VKNNSEIYCGEEADNYYKRNKKHLQSIFTEYLFNILPRKSLSAFDIAEFGIGNGQNLFYLKHFCHKVHGYEASKKAVADFKRQYARHPHKKDFSVYHVNLAKPITSSTLYDLIIYGFFQYYVSDPEMEQVKLNTLKMLKPDSYVYVYDFLARSSYQKIDKRNKNLKIYKRNIEYWVKYFDQFDLIDFRLFGDNSSDSNNYPYMDDLNKIDPKITKNDDRWLFAATFKKR